MFDNNLEQRFVIIWRLVGDSLKFININFFLNCKFFQFFISEISEICDFFKKTLVKVLKKTKHSCKEN